jgi:hypothetical protein
MPPSVLSKAKSCPEMVSTGAASVPFTRIRISHQLTDVPPDSRHLDSDVKRTVTSASDEAGTKTVPVACVSNVTELVVTALELLRTRLK